MDFNNHCIADDSAHNWWSGSEIDTSVDENDPYEFVTRELSDSGEVYDTELGYGEYVVGTDIPEGTYEVTLQSGYGSFQTDDPDNSIYLYGYFSENASDEDEDITEMEDVRLYEGAHVMIGEDVVLAFHTENGQTGQMQSEDNPLSVTYTLQPEKKYTVGKEIPAGVYDVSGTKDWAVMEYLTDEDIKAKYENGILKLSVPKKPAKAVEAKKTIAIEG